MNEPSETIHPYQLILSFSQGIQYNWRSPLVIKSIISFKTSSRETKCTMWTLSPLRTTLISIK